MVVAQIGPVPFFCSKPPRAGVPVAGVGRGILVMDLQMYKQSQTLLCLEFPDTFK